MFQKLLIVCCALGLVVVAQKSVTDTSQLTDPLHKGAYTVPPSGGGSAAVIIKQVNNFNANGSYQYSYETSDGTFVEESGHPSSSLEEQPIVVTGSFKYISPDGSPISVQYTADENGFQPQGSHLPGA